MKNRSVLIVEDDAAQANLLVRAFTGAGARDVRRAHDGVAALQEFEAFAPDAVIVDVMLPKMNGVSVARRIKELRPDVVVVGYSSVAKLREEEARSFDAWVQRRADTDPAELVAAVRAVLARRAAH